MQERCSTCKHWAGAIGARRGDCTNPKMLGYEDHDGAPDDALSLAEDDGTATSIETGREFGCVHHLPCFA